ncbi:hypothetical protein IT087_03045 [Candidatus Uhrbacteria bacterium]|nr:hypothetical protein [Candidatus Uhrbacteria bacterium]
MKQASLKNITGAGLLIKMLITYAVTILASVVYLFIAEPHKMPILNLSFGIFIGAFYGFVPAFLVAFIWEYLSSNKSK